MLESLIIALAALGSALTLVRVCIHELEGTDRLGVDLQSLEIDLLAEISECFEQEPDSQTGVSTAEPPSAAASSASLQHCRATRPHVTQRS